jgi:hypothetical protein
MARIEYAKCFGSKGVAFVYKRSADRISCLASSPSHHALAGMAYFDTSLFSVLYNVSKPISFTASRTFLKFVTGFLVPTKFECLWSPRPRNRGPVVHLECQPPALRNTRFSGGLTSDGCRSAFPLGPSGYASRWNRSACHWARLDFVCTGLQVSRLISPGFSGMLGRW